VETADQALAPYQGPEAAAYHGNRRALPPDANPWVCRSRARWLRQWISPDDAVFEYGCGFGWNLGALTCFRRCGYDAASDLRGPIEALGVEFAAHPGDLPDQSFTVGLCHHALQQVLEPSALLATMCRLVQPGGRLLAFVPFDHPRRRRRQDPHSLGHHLYSWTPQSLSALVSIIGFEVVDARIRRCGYDRRAALLAIKWGLGERGYLSLRHLARFIRPLREVEVVARRL